MQYLTTSGANPPWDNKLPPVRESVNKFHLDNFFRIMYERQEIWFKRFVQKKDAPWTKDKFLRNYKFTNVYRELDYHSQWEIRNIIMNKRLTRKDLIWQIILFRLFNKPETFEYMAKKTNWVNGLPKYNEYNQELFEELIDAFRKTGENPFTNAYLINSRASPGMTRDWCYCNKIVPDVHDAIPKINKVMLTMDDPQELIDRLIKLPGVANFVAHEFYISFCYVALYTERKLMSFDQNSYTNVGPGASLGIRLIFPSLKSNKQIEGIYRLRDMAPNYLKKFGNFSYLYYSKAKEEYFTSSISNITLHQIEMWLCEFSKYWKMSIGQGKQRSKFEPNKRPEFLSISVIG